MKNSPEQLQKKLYIGGKYEPGTVLTVNINNPELAGCKIEVRSSGVPYEGVYHYICKVVGAGKSCVLTENQLEII